MSAVKTDIWMPLYIGDYLADTMHLSAEQHGAYLLLLFHLWRHGTLPNDDADLARIARLTTARWRKHRPKLEKFFVTSPESWTHRRVEKERARIEQRAEANATRAKKGAAGRWGPAQEKTTAHALIDMLEACQSQSQTKTQTQTQTKAKAKAKVKTNFSSVVDTDFISPQPTAPDATPVKKSSATRGKDLSSADVSTKRLADGRHVPFRRALGEYWQEKNRACPQMPWEGRDAKALSDFLKASPALNEQQFRTLLANRARSPVAHGDRVYLWISNLTRFQEPLNHFNKPVSSGGGYLSRAEINEAATLNAMHEALSVLQECGGCFDPLSSEPSGGREPRLPADDGQRPRGPALALAGSSDYGLAERDFTHGKAFGYGPLPDYPPIAYPGRAAPPAI